MKRFLLALACAALTMITAACSEKDGGNALEKIQKKLVNLDTYTAEAQITQISNKGEKNYEVTQNAKKTGEYMMVVTAPEKIAGTVTIFNGTSTFQYNPRVEGSLKIDMPASQLRNEILLTSFIKNYLNSEDVTVETSSSDGAMATVLEAVIPGTNPYMKTEKLWVDNETQMPVKLVIYDETNSERIVVTYKKIEYNTKLGEDVFTIPELRKEEVPLEEKTSVETENGATENGETAEEIIEE